MAFVLSALVVALVALLVVLAVYRFVRRRRWF